LKKYFSLFNKVKKSELAFISRQISVMIKSGIPIVDSLNILKEESKNELIKNVMSSIIDQVEEGTEVHEALRNHPQIFPEFYCQMIKAGEKAGILEQVFDKLATFYTKQSQLIKDIKASLYYPITIFIVAVLVIVFLMINVIPQFVSIIDNAFLDYALETDYIFQIGFQSYNSKETIKNKSKFKC
jgi:type IV pilus assembly protein PilC